MVVTHLTTAELTSNMAKLQKRGLGKGLSSLLSDVDPSSYAESKIFSEIKLEDIEANPYQPRTAFEESALIELSESIKEHGIIQPITVRKLSNNKYQLVSGERRKRASEIAGLKVVPAYIRTADDQQMREMALIENIQREDLNAMEIALSYQRLITECNLNQEDLGKRVGKKRSTVTNYLRILKLPPDVQSAIRDNLIGIGHAKELTNLTDVGDQLVLLKRIIEEKLSVRKVEEIVRQALNPEEEKQQQTNNIPSIKALTPAYKRVQENLASLLGTKVQLKTNGKDKGEIKIPFHNVEDLNRILELIEK